MTKHTDAERYQWLQNAPIALAQAMFWNYESRRQRSEAIDKEIDDLNVGLRDEHTQQGQSL